MAVRFAVERPTSLEEACGILAGHPGVARVHAGGTDVLVQARHPARRPDLVVDLARIPGLGEIEAEPDGSLRIGARVPMTRLIDHEAMDRGLEGLRDAMKLVGSIQIRNRATLAGNICNASPAGDTVPVLVILEARVNLVGVHGRRSVPVAEFVVGPAKVARGQDEIVESVTIPCPATRSASAYLRAVRRRAVDLALTGVALRVDDTGEVRVSYCAVGPRPILGARAAALLRGVKPGATPDDDPPAVAAAAEAATQEVTPIDDVRASAEYRRAMTGVYLVRAFRLAHDRLSGSISEPRSQNDG